MIRISWFHIHFNEITLANEFDFEKVLFSWFKG